MKRFVFALLVLTACQNTADPAEEAFPKTELIEEDLGYARVYGLKITDYSTTKDYKGYAVQLSQGARVWRDTLYIELSGNDTLSTEVLFGEATVGDSAAVTFRVDPFDAQ